MADCEASLFSMRFIMEDRYGRNELPIRRGPFLLRVSPSRPCRACRRSPPALFAGYALQRSRISPQCQPEHQQFLPPLAVAILLVNAGLAIAGPDLAAACSSICSSIPTSWVRLVFDAVRLHAAIAAVAIAGLLVASSSPARALASRSARRQLTTTWAPWWSVSTSPPLCLHLGVGAARGRRPAPLMITIIPVTPFLAGEYTLLAFVIVIVGGLGSMTGALMGGLLIGVSEAVAGLLLQSLAQEHVQLRARSWSRAFGRRAVRQEIGVSFARHPLQHPWADASLRTLLELACVLLALLLVARRCSANTGLRPDPGSCTSPMSARPQHPGWASPASLARPRSRAGLGRLHRRRPLSLRHRPVGWRVRAVVAAVLAGTIVGYLGFRFCLLAFISHAHHRLQRVHAARPRPPEWAGGSAALLKIDAGTSTSSICAAGSLPFYYVILASPPAPSCSAAPCSRAGSAATGSRIREDAEAAQAVGVCRSCVPR